uniref:Ferritin n=1 Tax=Dolopus genitalis TaxID=2488630 RepID=A0A3G5BIL0_DOLGE|nr:venom polypeptide [Dolopus genitalis]
MKLFVETFTLALIFGTAFANLQCTVPAVDIPERWIDMTEKCINAVRNQIQREVFASFQYLAMAAHFAQDTVNRPGFAEHYFKAAREERQHATVLIDYLTMRGQLTNEVTDLIKIPTIEKFEWKTAVESLTDALELETNVTESIKAVIGVCEAEKKKDSKGSNNDYHLVDYLTGVYLEEQYKGERELAGKLSTLKKMMTHHGEIGEFLFDKTLLE